MQFFFQQAHQSISDIFFSSSPSNRELNTIHELSIEFIFDF